MNDVVEKLKQHVLERIDAHDWRGAMNLLDAMMLVDQNVTTSPQAPSDPPPVVEATSFDNDRFATMEAKENKLRG